TTRDRAVDAVVVAARPGPDGSTGWRREVAVAPVLRVGELAPRRLRSRSERQGCRDHTASRQRPADRALKERPSGYSPRERGCDPIVERLALLDRLAIFDYLHVLTSRRSLAMGAGSAEPAAEDDPDAPPCSQSLCRALARRPR